MNGIVFRARAAESSKTREIKRINMTRKEEEEEWVLFVRLNTGADCTLLNREAPESAWRQSVRLLQLQYKWSVSVYVRVCVCLFMCACTSLCDVLWDTCVSVHMFVPRRCCIIADGNQWPDNDNLLSVLLLILYLHTHTHTHLAVVLSWRWKTATAEVFCMIWLSGYVGNTLGRPYFLCFQDCIFF